MQDRVADRRIQTPRLLVSTYVANAFESKIDIGAPAVQALDGNATAEVLGVGSAQGQAVAQSGQGAASYACGGDGGQAVGAVAVRVREVVVVGEGGEGVGPDVGQDIGGDAATAVADADGDARGIVVEGLDVVRVEPATRVVLLLLPLLFLLLQLLLLLVIEGRLGGNGDDDGLAGAALDGGAEGVLEELGDDVFEVHGHEGEGGVGLAVNVEHGTGAVAELADVGDEAGAGLDGLGRAEGGVDNADVGWVIGARRRARVRVEVRLAAVVESDVLLGDEPGSDPGPQVAVKEARHLLRGDVSAALEEALCQDGDGVGMCGDELGEDLREADLVLGRCYGLAVGGGLGVGQQDGEGVQVVAVDAGDVGVGDDDVGQAAERLDAVGEADGEKREREVGRGEERSLRERRAAMSVGSRGS